MSGVCVGDVKAVLSAADLYAWAASKDYDNRQAKAQARLRLEEVVRSCLEEAYQNGYARAIKMVAEGE